MRILTPWCWIDDGNNLHFDVVQLLDAMGVKDTPANRDLCMSEASKLLHELFPDVPICGNTRETGTYRLYPGN